jgi:Helix-turn-helix of DDE superfamily endonuclease
MILRYQELSRHKKVFQSMTGLSLEQFDEVERDVEPRFTASEINRLSRPDRIRGLGGGREQELSMRDQSLLTIIWLRCYPKQDVLGYLFGVSESSVSRVVNRVLPLLEASGRDTMRMPDPGRKRRRALDELLQATPELAVIIDSFEQRVQRPIAVRKSNIPSKVRLQSMKSMAYSSMWPTVWRVRRPISNCSSNQRYSSVCPKG